METVCIRCHRPVQEEDLFCSGCGLPQLVFPPDGSPEQPTAEPWTEAVRDAGSVEWKRALRAALLVAVPAGLLSSELSALGGLAIFWMVFAAGWAVALYLRSQKPAWITAGAGARIGLVTGLIAAWVTFAVSSATLFVQRFFLGQSARIDGEWKTRVTTLQQLTDQMMAGMGQVDPAQAKATQAHIQAMLTPEGHAGWQALGMAENAGFLLLFAILGGALGARLLGRTRRSAL